MTSIETRLLFGTMLVVGLLGAVGASGTQATLGDAHVATGSASAVNDFGSSGPVAEAGGPYTVDEGNTVQLDGSGSSTSQGNIRDYSWQILSGPGSLSGANTVDPVYQAPGDVSQDTDVTVELTITTNKGTTDSDTATVTVQDRGTTGAPTVDSLTVTTTGNKNREIDISADVSDPTSDGDQLRNVSIEVVETQRNQVEYSNTITVSGDSATVNDISPQLKNKREYRVDVTVYDTNGGDSGSASETVTTG